jgi:hypothetical protein
MFPCLFREPQLSVVINRPRQIIQFSFYSSGRNGRPTIGLCRERFALISLCWAGVGYTAPGLSFPLVCRRTCGRAFHVSTRPNVNSTPLLSFRPPFSRYLPALFTLTCVHVRAYIPGMSTPTDLITIETAHDILNVSIKKVRQLIKDGHLTVYSSPLDGRRKFLSRAEVEALGQTWQERQAA